MKILTTPVECFANLPDFPWEPRYDPIPDGAGGQLRIAAIDAGPTDAEPVLMMHGEPSWSFLYRKMIPGIIAAGHRAVAPDLVGFGRSDKPSALDDYSYQRHVDWMTAWLRELDLARITLFCQDWGGLIGLRLAAENPDRFERIIVANTFLPTGEMPVSDAFLNWREYATTVEDFHVGGVIKGGTVRTLPEDIVDAYNAPFPDDSYKAGVRIFPALVPVKPEDPGAAANKAAWEVLQAWDKPVLTAFSDSDPITRGADLLFQSIVPGCRGQDHVTIVDAGHFLQEDKGEELAEVVVRFIEANPLGG